MRGKLMSPGFVLSWVSMIDNSAQVLRSLLVKEQTNSDLRLGKQILISRQ